MRRSVGTTAVQRRSDQVDLAEVFSRALQRRLSARRRHRLLRDPADDAGVLRFALSARRRERAPACFREPSSTTRETHLSARVADGRRVRASHRPRGSHASDAFPCCAARRVARMVHFSNRCAVCRTPCALSAHGNATCGDSRGGHLSAMSPTAKSCFAPPRTRLRAFLCAAARRSMYSQRCPSHDACA